MPDIGIDVLIGIIVAETSVVEDNVMKLLINLAGGGASESEVKRRLEALGITMTAAIPSRWRIESRTAMEIQSLLKTAGNNDLYEFLGMDRGASWKDLHAAATKRYTRLCRAPKAAETTAGMKLAGHCQTLFKDAANKRRYDNTLASESMDQFNSLLKIAGRDHLFSRREIDYVVEQARLKGIDETVARAHIDDYAREMRVGIERVRPADGAPAGMRTRPAGGSDARPPVAAFGVAADRKALVALYDATDGPRWVNRTNWKTPAPLDEWRGVTTDAVGRVIGLTLNRNKLSGPNPAALGALAKLEVLSLRNNGLSGRIPVALGNLKNLEELDLRNNRLSGQIPATLDTLNKLMWLRLGGNEVEAARPSAEKRKPR